MDGAQGVVTDAACQVCGDTGGATRLVLCENAARGCLGGIHLYCCIPLRAEPWADAWYCSECSQVLAEVATREKRQAAQRAAKRVAAAEVRRKERQDRKQRRQEEAEQRRRQQQNAQQQQRQQQPAAGGGRAAGYGPPLGRPATPVGTVVAAAAAGRPTAGSGRLVGAGGGAVVPARASLPARQQLVRQQRPPASVGGTPVARTDTLTMLFESLKGDEEAAKRRAQEMGRVVDGTSRRLSSIITESDEAIRLLHERHSLKCCTLAGLKGVFPLQLPLAHQRGSFAASLLCYGIPGNLHSGAAAQRLEPLAAATSAGRQPPACLMWMDELGIHQDRAWQQASMLLVLGQAPPSQQEAMAQQWMALWEMLRRDRQAIHIPIPAVAAGGGGREGDGGAATQEGLELFLVPNLLDPASMTLFGLLAVPIPLERPDAAAARAPGRGILHRTSAAALVPTTAASGPAAAAGQDARRLPLAWADAGQDDKPGAESAAALELGLGAHYATPRRRAVQVSRPARLPSIRTFVDDTGAPKPLEGLRVALVGFTKHHEMTAKILEELRGLGASTYTNQVTVADVLMLHPTLIRVPGLERCSDVLPLGLAHLLASSSVHAFHDSSFLVLREMIHRRRPLQGSEWLVPQLSHTVAFPAGILVVLDAPTLQQMEPAQLTQVLSEVQRLAAASTVPRCLWHVVATPADLAVLKGAAEAGRTPAAENWQIWQHWQQQQSRIARPLTNEELSFSSNPGDPPPVVKHAVKSAKVHMGRCRLVYLSTMHEETLRQAETQNTILSGSVQHLIEFLQSR